MSWRQLRLLLWKDYLIRKRKLITLAGILWATAVMISLYIVRANVNNSDFPTCQFPARALPSAGMITFLQSFICSVNNECSPMEQFDEIPSYDNSKLTQLQRKFSPLLYNETVLDVAATVPDALKLLSKLADIADEPSFVELSQNGLRVNDLFANPTRVRRYISSHLDVSDDVAHTVMMSKLSFQGLLKGFDRCSSISVSETLEIDNVEHMEAFVNKLCSLANKDLQNILMDLLMEINFNKYINMLGNMYYKLNGDNRLTELADTVTAVLRMTRLQNFLPAELVAIMQGEDVDFSYIDLNLLPKLMDLLKPTFADTDAYKSIRDIADTAVIGVQYLSKFLVKQANDTVEEATALVGKAVENKSGFKSISKALNNAVEVFRETMSNGSTFDVFNLLTQVTNFIYKYLPDNLKHELLLYSTLLTKLIEGAHKVIDINMNIEERAYNISLRHPEGVKILVGLPTSVIGKGFEALADAERTQIATAKINTPGHIFCDANKIQGFFEVSKNEASLLKTQLCTDSWKNYVTDLIRTFGVYEVRDNINTMASLFIQETLGKDTTEQLYTIDYDFLVLKNFTQALNNMNSEATQQLDWNKVFNVTEDSVFIKTIRSKAYLGKQMLITVHGALAKEVVKQNPILSFKITPVLIDMTTLVMGINKQLDSTDKELVGRVKEIYPMILQMVLGTALDEDKTYRSLSAHSEDIMCNGLDNASLYLQLPSDVNVENFVTTMCDLSTAIENGLKKDSDFGKAIESITKSKHGTFSEVPWTTLITGLKDLYVKLDRDYPYLFQYSSYNMDKETNAAVDEMFVEAKEFWFGKQSLEKSLHLSLKLLFRLLDLMDRKVFGMTNEIWIKVKYSLDSISGPLVVFDDVVKLVTALYRNESTTSDLPPATVAALIQIIPNIPELLVDATDIIVRDDTDIEQIISLLNAVPHWPCSTSSLTELLPLTLGSKRAVEGLEILFCLDTDFQTEWIEYLDERNVTFFDIKKWNTTSFNPHIFLRFSSVFDSLIEDSTSLVEVVQDMSSGNEVDGHTSWAGAARYAIDIFNGTEKDSILGNFFTKLDMVLNSINTSSVPDTLPLNVLWSIYFNCTEGQSIDGDCQAIGRAAWKYSLQFISVMFENVLMDLLTYFKEINEPNSTLLQLVGFTKRTTLYEIYDKLPEFIGVLMNSYWDYGFMSQIRRASLSQFWDCEAVVNALLPAADSPIDEGIIQRIQPYVCPSFLYWLSLPRGDNILVDIVSKPNYFLYTLEVQNLTSSYKDTYSTLTELTNFLTDIAEKNKTTLSEEELKLNTLEGKLNNLVDTVLNYKINESDKSYRLFNEINKKQFVTNIYLTRVVGIINKLMMSVENLTISDLTNSNNDELIKKLKSDLSSLQTMFKRKPSEVMAFHFDLITNAIWPDVDDKYNLNEVLDATCNDLKNNDTRKDILVDNQRLKTQICSKNYQLLYKTIYIELTEDYEKSKDSLKNLVRMLQNDDDLDNVTNIAQFLSQRKQLVSSLRTSIKYSYELGIPIYLKYLQSKLQHYDVIISFLSGGDWWKDLRELYHGPYANKFFDSLEKSFEIVEDVLTNLDKIHLVRLFRDINVNDSDAFCMPNIVLSDYIPDSTGILSELKLQMCEGDKTELFRELPPLLFASQGYDSSLRLTRDINYTALNLDISKTETRLELVRNGPLSPQRPHWVTVQKMTSLREAALRLLSKETLTKVSFGVLSNLVDAGTLFLNNSQCTMCSQFTSWIKQLNLQIFKKQEYDALLCRAREMSLDDIYYSLRSNFHWDMAIRELISTRNYTKYELNKSINEFLELVKLHLLEDLLATTTKLSECLTHNVTRNEFGNATLFVSVLSQTARLLRAETPHLHEIDGITDLPYLKHLYSEVAHNLDVYGYLKENLREESQIEKDLMKVVGDKDVVGDIVGGKVNLRLMVDAEQTLNMELNNNYWENICKQYDCEKITKVISNNVNKIKLQKELEKLQTAKFWRFTFVSNILQHLEGLLTHVARLLGVASKMDVPGLVQGRLDAMVDFVMQVMMDDTLKGILYSLQGLVEELHPLLQQTPLDFDLRALGKGLSVLHEFRNYLLNKVDLKVEVSKFYTNPDRVESGLSKLGINHTNFWSIAAPRVHAGHIDLKPVISSKQGDYHVSSFVCQIESMSSVILPSNLDVVTADDVYGAIADQFCGLEDQRVKEMVAVLMGGLNFGAVVEKLKDILLPQLYSASNLTQSEGDAVLDKFPRMAALLPVIQDNVGELADTIAKEPLVQDLGGSSSVGGLLSSPKFLSHAGNMLCGKPFQTDENRFYKAIAQSQDFSNEPDQAQLEVLPTDFCRELYKDIVSMDGGKIVWSFVKPLIMGKILYTPSNPTVEKIMEKANSSFSHMIKLTSLIHSFSNSFSSLDELSHHRAGVSALRQILTSPSFADLRKMIIGDGEVPNVKVDGLFDDFGDIQGIGNVLKRGSDLLHCINLDRFHAVTDEYQLTHEAVKLSRVNEFSAGIVFLNTEGQGEALRNVEYKIRMDIENAPTTTRKQNYLWIPGPESSFIEHMRYFRGFIQIQDMIDKAIIELSRSSAKVQKRETRAEDELKWAVYTQQEPYPCYRKDFFQTSLYESQALIVAFFFSLLFTVSSAVRFIVADKESGNTMLMSVMGVDLSNHTLSWFLASLLELVATCVCVALVLSAGGILPHSATSLVLALLIVLALAVLAFCYMMSKLFTSASLGAVCTAIAYLVTFMPFIVILSLEAVLTSTLKLLVCLSMSSAICYSFLYVTRYEAMGVGAQWADVWSAPDGEDMSIVAGALMALADALLYLVIGYLIDRFFGPKSLQSSIIHCHASGEKAGVSIVGVSKSYGRGRRRRLALDNVSVELHQGQITTLLGHNGAGKTTLINILIGTLKPSKGHVSIRSGREAGTRVGVCPQRDVLLDYMTPSEHVAFYAQLKSGRALADVQAEVDSILQVLSLGPVAHEPAARLSGGTRRRLCVALAFVARPHLVSLDEPTAGVDPAARRDIWSMIVKLREDRTILLTTHHLDEAELLSDQIVIMHKGQVHTTGSPIEIKRSLGNGYKLTVMYPDQRTLESEPWLEDEGLSIEERSKQLMAVVRDGIKNASLVDVNGLEVEIALPFFDSNGLNSNFLQLCTSLEASKQQLGYSSYSLDCSSLEQVFFNICQQADAPVHGIEYDPDTPSKSASTSSIKSDQTPLVPAEGPLRGSSWSQFVALLHARYIHYTRNRWLLFLLIILPSLFVATAMGFSMIRPPADNEVSLRLTPELYGDTTQYLVSRPSIYSKDMDPSFAERVMHNLWTERPARNWTSKDTPTCKCRETRQECDINKEDYKSRPQMLLLPDVDTLNNWMVASHEVYIERRYGGFSSSLKNNKTNLIAWYNNKGHHAMPAYLNALNNALLRTVAGDSGANITVYSHPLKISKEQISKDTVYQHIADAGISGLVLIAYSLVSGGAAIYLVSARRSQEKRLQLLCGVSPKLYWAAAMTADMTIVLINLIITVIVFEAFGFPVFVARNNLPAICILIILYGYACGAFVHVAEKLFSEASMANMILFCGNAFIGLVGITLLLILDIISESDETDNARWVLHKVFLLCPQFVLGDGLLEIAKNTIQAQVLYRFGMDTYKDPLGTDLIVHHYIALVLVGTALLLLNLAIEYDWFDVLLSRFRPAYMAESRVGEMEDMEVAAERKRVHVSITHAADKPVRLTTIGNINAGFVDTEVKNNSIKRVVSTASDVAQCVELAKVYPALGGRRVAVKSLTLGIPPGQCTALLGQNGAGKSTTFSMLTGEVRPTSGTIYLNEKLVDSRKLCHGLISYCPQSDAIDPLMTVRETLVFYCQLRGITEQDEVIKRALDMFDLTKYRDARNGTLSGGNKRKLCAAVAFMGRTPLVLLDEPTSGMDPGSRACVARGVRMACACQRGVLLSTHALDDARRLAARVALVRAGELCALASLDDCLKRFGGGYVVACRVSRGGARAVWRRVRELSPAAVLRVLHHATVHFLLPTHATVNEKHVTTSLSDIFRLMAQLQGTCDIEDYTVNQSSLDQMFLSFTEKGDEDLEPLDVELLPTPHTLRRASAELNSITTL